MTAGLPPEVGRRIGQLGEPPRGLGVL
jgi:hypothetical protein